MIAGLRNVSGDFMNGELMRPYDEVFELICKNIKISDSNNGRFLYFIDIDYVMDTTIGYRWENLTPAYDKILQKGLEELKYSETNTDFRVSYNKLCDSLELLAGRIIEYLVQRDSDDRRIEWFRNLSKKPAKHFEEAIQRMLFINQMFWQTDHRLVGLGAWDSFLYPYYESDIKDELLTRETALVILEDLFRVLHENFKYKSNVLMGDTGQIFVLGRSTPSGEYICNELTYLFIEAMKNVQQPDPKCLLRINKKTPSDLLEVSVDSIATGIGAPLMANDDIIVPCLTGFGIKPEDACEYVTSACWEPLIGGKSSCNNNRTPLNYLRALDNMIKREDLSKIDSFDALVDKYLQYLKLNLKAVKRVLMGHRFQSDMLLTVFIDGCFENEKDISNGGAQYGDLGITSVAIGNTIDSLLNIRKYVFDENKYTLYDVKKMIIMNYEGYGDVLAEIKKEKSYYGRDEAEVIELVQKIMDYTSKELSEYDDGKGSRIKVGLSGAAYMDAARGFGASFDGRRAGEPFTVHISNEENDSFTEIVNFASALSYKNNQFNGNVLDFMVSPDFINNNKDKFISFIKGAVNAGFFEMQMNVVSSKTLIEARKDPDKFPNLIVRVWGFSAYFNDLPDDYKDVLVKRALENEKKTA